MAIEPGPMKTSWVEVRGLRVAYTEMGRGAPILFQHGNPTSRYLWRNILPQLADLGRCIAVDLIGMGQSDKLPGSGPMRYDFATHAGYLAEAWDVLGVKGEAVLVLHDWGSALGFDWAQARPEAVQGIAYMEAITAPVPDWEAWPEAARGIFQAMRSPAGEAIVLEKNAFVEKILPASILRDLSPEEMAQYRAPFLRPEDRWPMLDWPRQIPIGGEPPEIAAIVARYADWLAQSPVPKLFVNAEPGSILVGPQREACRAWPNQTEVTVPGSHFLQEDSPDEIVAALRAFVLGLRGGA
ncbi:haloalkane dehalogenase [Dinoroseobacter sp. S76]|uniref:haloalkane dehalogenase n=1 Tax=Dinoroseobacter sp. S76 TaxID=3415124 RepID=UPI003C7B0A14